MDSTKKWCVDSTKVVCSCRIYSSLFCIQTIVADSMRNFFIIFYAISTKRSKLWYLTENLCVFHKFQILFLRTGWATKNAIDNDLILFWFLFFVIAFDVLPVFEFIFCIRWCRLLCSCCCWFWKKYWNQDFSDEKQKIDIYVNNNVVQFFL